MPTKWTPMPLSGTGHRWAEVSPVQRPTARRGQQGAVTVLRMSGYLSGIRGLGCEEDRAGG